MPAFRGVFAAAVLLGASALLGCSGSSPDAVTPTATPTVAGPVLNSFRYNIRVEGTNLFPAPAFGSAGTPAAGSASPTTPPTPAATAAAPVPLVLTETGEISGPSAMRSRMTTTAAAGRLRAKTGTLSGVSALSGYVTTAEGEELAFALVVNRTRSIDASREAQDSVGVRLASFARTPLEARSGN